MNAKSVVLTHWKLISHLKAYFSKFTTDSAFENALNREFAQFLQKIDPKTYGKDVIRYLSSPVSVKQKQKQEKDIIKTEQEKGIISFPNMFGSIFKDEPEPMPLPKWKTAKRVVTKETAISRTTHILSSLALAETEPAKLARIEDLIIHLKTYPETKHGAVKEGAIRLLLRLKRKHPSENVQSAINVAFALLGYSKPVAGNGIRILSIDGGGTRGVLVIEMLRKLEELSGKPVYEMFDLICGVSTGAILGSLIGLKQHSLDEAAEIYKRLSSQVFTQSALKGTSNLVLSHSYYDTELWEKLLSEQWDKTLIETNRNLKCPKYCAVSAVVNHSRISAYLFRNYSLPWRVQSQYFGGYDHQVWEAVRASSAAPTYFEEFKIGNMIHQDGGILVNNPTAIAIHEAKLLWPSTPIQCVVSFGTGRTVPNPIETTQPSSTNNTSWKLKFLAILDSATDTEGVHTMLSDLLPEGSYYRFNPYLTEMFSMSEIEPEKFAQLERDAIMYLRRNEDKFHHATQKLGQKKGLAQECGDWISLQKQIFA
ncbi:calcium-independent phospholipase A2-gamma-like [Euwallacea fornicatus]|uniref:calcium-independent phospholipase A2-gamma-like n=1 Tax=Euwallacea fornicatus TaxID=995702 RepID=UPI00338D453F